MEVNSRNARINIYAVVIDATLKYLRLSEDFLLVVSPPPFLVCSSLPPIYHSTQTHLILFHLLISSQTHLCFLFHRSFLYSLHGFILFIQLFTHFFIFSFLSSLHYFISFQSFILFIPLFSSLIHSRHSLILFTPLFTHLFVSNFFNFILILFFILF
ncbi:RC3H [Acanthosepion pharaonis]|uniref:RC3H n=1 Tax=Acanthosepion pharaonis TaxID=158019 RepID=A0A812BF05_ACAPH|nr:RC3H [Sepia pharaonis]